MSLDIIKKLVEKVIWFLRRDNIVISSCEIREKKSKYEIYLKPEDNVAGLSAVKIIINKINLKYRVYTNRESFEIRIKKLIQRELSKMAGLHESSPQEKSTNRSSSIKRPHKANRRTR